MVTPGIAGACGWSSASDTVAPGPEPLKFRHMAEVCLPVRDLASDPLQTASRTGSEFGNFVGSWSRGEQMPNSAKRKVLCGRVCGLVQSGWKLTHGECAKISANPLLYH